MTSTILTIGLSLAAGAFLSWLAGVHRRSRMRGEDAALTARCASLEGEVKIWQRFVELVTDGLWIWHVDREDGRDEDRLEYYSDRFFELFGEDPATKSSHPREWMRLIHPEDLKAATEAFIAHKERGEPYNLKVRYRHANGSTVHVICRGELVEDADGGRRMFGAHQNITDLVEALGRLKESNEELGHFAYAASHDLKQPLRTVASYVQLCQEEWETADPAQLRRWLGYAQAGALRGQGLVDHLLVYSRAARRQYQAAPIDADGVLASVLQDLHAELASSKATVATEQLGVVVADVQALHHILQNLIENALKFVPEGRRPAVQVYRRGAAIVVEDNGIGIPEDQRGELFRPFTRLHPLEEYSGTGLGLAIVAQTAAKLGGSVGIETAEAGGCRFVVQLQEVASDAA